MSALVNELRTRGDVIRLPSAGADAIVVRVEMPEVWDVVRVAVSPSDSVSALKQCALAALYPTAEGTDEFVMKLRGFEVLDETASMSTVGAADGSIFLVTYRRRRPVR